MIDPKVVGVRSTPGTKLVGFSGIPLGPVVCPRARSYYLRRFSYN